jgi:hypothetical protein
MIFDFLHGRPGLYHSAKGFTAYLGLDCIVLEIWRLHLGLLQLTADNTLRDLKIQCPYMITSRPDNVEL